MNSDILLTCRFSLHNNKQIEGFCPFPQCNNFRLFCVNCLLDYHQDHTNECKKLYEYPQWAEMFNQIHLENINKLESILEIFVILKQFKAWYETQYNPLIDNQESLNVQMFEQKITNMVNIKYITNIIDQSIKPQIEKMKTYLEYIMNQTGKIKNLFSYDEFIQSHIQSQSSLSNRSQRNYEETKSLYWAGKYQECINKCEAYQKFNITDVRFSLMKGDSYLELKNFEKAIENYQIAIEMDDSCYYAYGKIGDINLNTGNLQEALKHYDECTKINNQQQEYYIKKAKIYQKLNQFKQGLEQVDHLLQLNSTHIEALQMKGTQLNLNLATLLLQLDQKKSWIDQSQQSLQFSTPHIQQFLQHQLKLGNQILNGPLEGQILSKEEINFKYQQAYNQLEKNPKITLQICREIVEKEKCWLIERLVEMQMNRPMNRDMERDKINIQFLILSGHAYKNLGIYQEVLNICEIVKKIDPNNQEIESLEQIIYTLIQ
ncbi:unnamed protein product [Paramecium primaurelia]|uniref:Tetratricopeptide repeat protein n=1 Tax=Paramecium primaurelia TaxID=5886 RepID=A0A8S1JP75_PARPR|nr:unnamed protein product [Paramecium primaurelia]